VKTRSRSRSRVTGSKMHTPTYEYLKLILKFFFYVSIMRKNIILLNTIFEFERVEPENKILVKNFTKDDSKYSDF